MIRNGKLKAYIEYYRERFSLLNRVGCLDVPPTIVRNIHIQVPDTVDQAVANRFAKDLIACLNRLTNKNNYI